MPTGPKYRLNPAGFRRHLLQADFMQAAMIERAYLMKGEAEAVAPVYEEGPHPGRYKAAFRVRGRARGGTHKDRGEAILYNTAPEALAVEFGTRHNPAHHVLTRALDTIPGRQYKRADGVQGSPDE